MKHRAPLIGALVAVVLTAGYWFLLYKPAVEEQNAFEAETAELETEQSQLRNQIAQLEQVKADEVAIRAAMARLEEYVPVGVAQPQVVRHFQETADAAGVEITSVTFGEPTTIEGAPDTGNPETALASISVSMVIEGGYFQAVDFFRRVEQDVPRAVLTQSVNIGEGQKKFPSLETTWGGQLFAVVPVSSIVPPADPNASPEGEGAPEGEQGGGEADAETGDEKAGDTTPDDTTPDDTKTDDGEMTTARGKQEGDRS